MYSKLMLSNMKSLKMKNFKFHLSNYKNFCVISNKKADIKVFSFYVG